MTGRRKRSNGHGNAHANAPARDRLRPGSPGIRATFTYASSLELGHERMRSALINAVDVVHILPRARALPLRGDPLFALLVRHKELRALGAGSACTGWASRENAAAHSACHTGMGRSVNGIGRRDGGRHRGYGEPKAHDASVRSLGSQWASVAALGSTGSSSDMSCCEGTGGRGTVRQARRVLGGIAARGVEPESPVRGAGGRTYLGRSVGNHQAEIAARERVRGGKDR